MERQVEMKASYCETLALPGDVTFEGVLVADAAVNARGYALT